MSLKITSQRLILMWMVGKWRGYEKTRLIGGVIKSAINTVISMAEGLGLEPRHLSASPDFKSGSLANSDIPPYSSI